MLKVSGSEAPPSPHPQRNGQFAAGCSHGGEGQGHQGQLSHRDQCEPGELAEPDQGFRDFEFALIKSVKAGTTTSTGLASGEHQRVQVTGAGARLWSAEALRPSLTRPETSDECGHPKQFQVGHQLEQLHRRIPCPAWSWLDANDANGDGLPETVGDFVSGGSNGGPLLGGPFGKRQHPGSVRRHQDARAHQVVNSKARISFDGTTTSWTRFLMPPIPCPTLFTGNPGGTILIAADGSSNDESYISRIDCGHRQSGHRPEQHRFLRIQPG